MPLSVSMSGSGPFELFSIEIVGDVKTQRALEAINAGLSGSRLIEPWERATELVASAVRTNVPSWRGELLASIEDEILQRATGIVGVIYSDKFYAPFQERGTDPYFPDIDALRPWAADHGVSAVYLAKLIAARGLIPLKFFEKAMISESDVVHQLIGDYVAVLIEKGY